MADFLQNLDPASLTYDPNQVFSLNPMNQPPVSHPDPATLDAGLQRAAELGLQVGIPAGLAGLGGPLSLGWRALGPAISAMIGGPLDSAGIGRPQGMPSNMLEGAIPDPEQAGLTAEQVLAAAAGKNKLPYSKFQAKNPSAGSDMFDFGNAQPAIPGSDAQIPRNVPARGVSDRMKAALADPEVGQALRAAVQKGVGMMPESWYRTGPLYDVFQQELGDKATEAYQKFMQMVAATSPRNKVPDNIRTGSYYYHLDQTGQPIPDKPAPGYGSIAQKNHIKNVLKVQDGGMDPMVNPKPVSFAANLMGNETPVTIDTHNFRLLGMASKDPRFLANSVEDASGKVISKFNPRQAYEQGKLTIEDALKEPTYWQSAPQKNEYGAYETYQQDLAQKMGMTPAQFQEKMWVGGGSQTGLKSPPETFLRTVAKRVQYTAARLGVDPQVVLQKFVRGEIPLLSLGAGGVALEGLSSDKNQPTAGTQ